MQGKKFIYQTCSINFFFIFSMDFDLLWKDQLRCLMKKYTHSIHNVTRHNLYEQKITSTWLQSPFITTQVYHPEFNKLFTAVRMSSGGFK